jgi:polyhydroxybutyrate depolymerase
VRLALALLGLLSSACATTSTRLYAEVPEGTLGGDRPARLTLPSGYDPTRAYPLLLLLHGYGNTGDLLDGYLELGRRVRAREMVLLVPEGTRDGEGNQFWNAGPACCDFAHEGVDDVAYLTALVEEAKRAVHIDDARVYVLGHSNGGFMAYRLSCEAPGTFAAVASLAGSNAPGDTASADETILYEGTQAPTDFPAPYPGALDTARGFAERFSCGAPDVAHDTLDLDRTLSGRESSVTRFPGCRDGVRVELWTIEGGSHMPAVSSAATDHVLDFLLAQRRR